MRRKSSSPSPDDADAAREKCLRLLSLRARSASELRQRLKSAGYTETVVESVLADLAGSGLVDDAEFARSWVASRQAAGGVGKRKLRWELRRKGVAQDVIEQAVGAALTDETEAEQALALASRRLGGSPDERNLARVRRLLLGRGFGFDTVESVIRRLISDMEHS
jgi:regulatory protein